jgi:hypothetical protein
MTEPTLTERVTILEQKVNEFASLPSRVAGVELQIVHLRDEVQVGFSAVRQEMAVMRDDLRSELHRGLHGIRGELNGVRGELDGIHGTLNGVRGELDGIHGTLNGVRGELDGIHGTLSGVRGELDGIHGTLNGVRGELDGIHGTLSGVRGELDGIRGELNGLRGLRAEIREGDEETRRFMRVLHEDLIARIVALGNARR